MYKILRRESLKRLLPRIIGCVLVIVILLGICASGLLRLAMGPKPLADMNPDDPAGSYVSLDASEVIVAFASLSSKSDSGTKTLKTYYLLPAGDGRYMAVLDRKEQNGDVLEKAMEQSREYYLGDLTTLTPLGQIHGIVTKLDDNMQNFMTDCIDNYQLPGYEEGRDSANLIFPYQVELNHVSFLSETVAQILGVAVLMLMVLLLIQLAVLIFGCYQRRVRKVIGEEPENIFAMAQIERVRVGTYILYNKGPGSRAIKTADVIWGYAMPEPMVVSKYRWPVALYDNDQHMIRLNFMEQKHCEEFLDVIAAKGHPFVKGYTSDYAEKFQNDFAAFQAEAARKVDAEQA